jgi:hypothetical protein
VLTQLGVLGGGSGGTTTTLPPGGTGGGATTLEVPTFTVDPTILDFRGGDAPRTVRVRNTGSVDLTGVVAQVTGPARAQFSVSAGECGAPVRPGLSCELRVTFSPAGALQRFNAVLEVAAQGARGQEVTLTASTLLG